MSNAEVLPDRQSVIDQVSTVMTWIRRHEVSWFGLNVNDGELVVHLHREVGDDRLLPLIPWESQREGELAEPGSALAGRSVTGRAFGGVVVSLLTWRPPGEIGVPDASDPIDSAVTLQVAGGVL